MDEATGAQPVMDEATGASVGEPSVAAIVLNWNGAHLLPGCLESLLAQDHPRLEVMVADNGSTDDSRAVAERLGVRFEALGRNLGFAPGNNAGARRADAEFLLFVNNDMRFAPDMVRRLVAPAAGDPSVFACDARQLDWDGARRIHGANGLRRGGRLTSFLPFLDVAQDDRAGDVLWGNGGNLLVRSEMFRALSGFYEPYVIDLEDLDLCWRAWLRGWRTVHVPEAVVYHRVGAAYGTPEARAGRRRSQARNEILLGLRLLPPRLAFLVVARALLRLGGLAVRLDGRELVSRGRGVGAALAAAPRALRERAEIRRTSATSSSALLRRFTR